MFKCTYDWNIKISIKLYWKVRRWSTFFYVVNIDVSQSIKLWVVYPRTWRTKVVNALHRHYKQVLKQTHNYYRRDLFTWTCVRQIIVVIIVITAIVSRNECLLLLIIMIIIIALMIMTATMMAIVIIIIIINVSAVSSRNNVFMQTTLQF